MYKIFKHILECPFSKVFLDFESMFWNAQFMCYNFYIHFGLY